jgi:hypothetical protein
MPLSVLLCEKIYLPPSIISSWESGLGVFTSERKDSVVAEERESLKDGRFGE